MSKTISVTWVPFVVLAHPKPHFALGIVNMDFMESLSLPCDDEEMWESEEKGFHDLWGLINCAHIFETQKGNENYTLDGRSGIPFTDSNLNSL